MRRIFTQLWPLFIVVLIAGCATMQSRWKHAESANTITAYEEFLKLYPTGELAKEAHSRIQQLHFKQAEIENTISAYKDFLRRYPRGILADRARENIERVEWQRIRGINTIGAYREFITSFPQSNYVNEAISIIRNKLDMIRVIGLIVKQKYYIGKKEINYRLLIDEDCTDVLKNLGYAVVTDIHSHLDSVDAVLNLTVQGELLGKNYNVGWLWTGSNIKIEASLLIKDNVANKTGWTTTLSPFGGTRASSERIDELKKGDPFLFYRAWDPFNPWGDLETGLCGLYFMISELTSDVDRITKFIKEQGKHLACDSNTTTKSFMHIEAALDGLRKRGNDKTILALLDFLHNENRCFRTKWQGWWEQKRKIVLKDR